MKSLLLLFLFAPLAYGVEAPGAPGRLGTSPRPDKEAYGTTRQMPLWFSVARGAVAEIAYPHVDRVQTRDSFLLVRENGNFLDERELARTNLVRVPHTLAFSLESRGNGIRVKKEITPHPTTTALLIDYEVEFPREAEREFLFVHNPTAERTPGGDALRVVTGFRGEPVLLAEQLDVRFDEPAALQPVAIQSVSWSLKNSQASVGFEGESDPETLVRERRELPYYNEAKYGNVTGALVHKSHGRIVQFRVVIAFGPKELSERARAALSERWLEASRSELLERQTMEWQRYLAHLHFAKNDSLAEASILVLKALEDKVHRGAVVAAPANPALPWRLEAEELDYEQSRVRRGDSNGGYRRVWPRDLFHIALAFHAVGDKKTVHDILDWLRLHQKRAGRVGTWSQNAWVDGAASWDAYQADETALPIVLTARLVADGIVPYAPYREMVLRAADALLRHGPGTEQERWEENGGLSPNTLATIVEGLAAAAWLETKHGPSLRSGRYISAANEWSAQLKNWLLVPRGFWGERYFARLEIGGPKGWNPAEHRSLHIGNKAPGTPSLFSEDSILDGGFLQWIIAGLVDPHDEDFSRTLSLYDRVVRKETPWGIGYRRYNEDAYGVNHEGGAWPLLSAERALTALERGESYAAERALVQRSANTAGMIAEQDTASAGPLAWSHAAYLLLERSIQDGKSFYRSEVVLKNFQLAK